MTQPAPDQSFSGGSRGAGVWNLYFIGKFVLLWLNYIQLKGTSINSKSQFSHFADNTQENTTSLSTDSMLRLFCKGSC